MKRHIKWERIERNKEKNQRMKNIADIEINQARKIKGEKEDREILKDYKWRFS